MTCDDATKTGNHQHIFLFNSNSEATVRKMPGQERGVMRNLFEGARFWVSQHVPQPSKIKEMIKVIASPQVLKT